MDYDAENNLIEIEKSNGSLEFVYGHDKMRRKSIVKDQNDQIIKTKYFQSNYEEVTESGSTKKIHYISAPTGLAAINVMDAQGTNTIYYALTDHLGSLNMLIEDDGTIAEEFAFDAWGKRRDASNWANSTTTTSSITDRGFTLHEHLDDFGLIHMNGRVYCPTTMQFVSPDPFIQSPSSTQNYNRYAYCMNKCIS